MRLPPVAVSTHILKLSCKGERHELCLLGAVANVHLYALDPRKRGRSIHNAIPALPHLLAHPYFLSGAPGPPVSFYRFVHSICQSHLGGFLLSRLKADF